MAAGTDVRIGRQLKERRQQLDLSRLEMAQITGIGRNRIARLERGEGHLHPAELPALLSGYQITLVEWIGGGVLDRATPQTLEAINLLSDGEFQALATFTERLVAGRAARPE